ncbi:MAG: ABC transporter ATP-binding protein [Anaerolineales bacterium]|nr:ABC transporter ATP-binding protein [Anaerolineales bacterium]
MTDRAAELEITDLRKDFDGLMAVFDVSFSVGGGEIVALIGPNGAGKTTIFNMLSGVLPATGGSIRYRGRLLNGLRPHAINRLGLARTYQNVRLFGTMTVLENVMVGRHAKAEYGVLSTAFRLPAARRQETAIRTQALRQLERVGLADKAEAEALSLPFGQQRLLEIARALATEPRLLLLDEAGSGLNRPEKDELQRLIRSIRDGGVAVLLVEHDIPFVTGLSDRIVVLEHGVKIAEGTPAEIRSDKRVIAAYLGEDVRDLC